MFRRNSILVKEVILKALREQGLETPLLQKRLIDSWPEVMGPAIASYTDQLYIRNQTLFVHLTSPALRFELSMQRQDIVNRLNAHAGSQVIADVFVEAADDVLTLHGEFHAEGGIGEVDEKRLVADVEGGGVGGNGLAHDVGPGVDEALLEEGRL